MQPSARCCKSAERMQDERLGFLAVLGALGCFWRGAENSTRGRFAARGSVSECGGSAPLWRQRHRPSLPHLQRLRWLMLCYEGSTALG